jgi:RNA polymerase sigma factor (sigma-70 family)
MPPDFPAPGPSPFEAARTVSSHVPPARDIPDWSGEMTAVSRSRDHGSFMRIYDHFMPRLCLYLRGLGSTEAIAEELAQEALLRLWQRAERYDPERSSLCTWLFRIGRNLHIDRVRREHGWSHTLLVVDQVLAEDGPSGSSAEDYADHVHLKRRIDELSAIQARLVRMSYFEAKTHHEIAEELDLPLGTVKSHLRRAFLKLQSQLGEPR